MFMKRRTFATVTLAVGLVMAISGAWTSLAAEEFQIITTPRLKQWLAASQKPLLVFTLSQVEFYEERIPGSVCIPTEEMQRTAALPETKDTPIVFYCKGPG
jgi:hypothetical protein